MILKIPYNRRNNKYNKYIFLPFQIIGFSFYGNPNSALGKARKYFKGIQDNLELIPKFYDGWVLR